ncbi:MAG: DUF3795 domain-containing protein, partial [Bacillota bacterium]|nr:DUF3795 domain-containing protein [Bacillota bacterium]
YCVAVNLLPVEDIENIMRQVSENSYINNLEKKEKSEYLVNLFQNLANQQGILLKLRKKPFKK